MCDFRRRDFLKFLSILPFSFNFIFKKTKDNNDITDQTQSIHVFTTFDYSDIYGTMNDLYSCATPAYENKEIIKQELQITWRDGSTSKYAVSKIERRKNIVAINKQYCVILDDLCGKKRISTGRYYYSICLVYKTPYGFILGVGDAYNLPLGGPLPKNADIIYYDIVCKEIK